MEVAASLLDPRIVAAINKYADIIDYIHFSDQFSGAKQPEWVALHFSPISYGCPYKPHALKEFYAVSINKYTKHIFVRYWISDMIEMKYDVQYLYSVEKIALFLLLSLYHNTFNL